MTALDIQQELWRELGGPNQLVMPNFRPRNWWECDVLSVSKAGYWSEFEIKISVSDFKADAKKERRHQDVYVPLTMQWVNLGSKSKHELLASHSEHGPSFFWYVVPDSIADKIEVPEWAGLRVATFHPARKSGDYFCADQPERMSIVTRKKAPRLHKHKIDQGIVTHARGVCYWRYWNLKADLQKSVKRELSRLEVVA